MNWSWNVGHRITVGRKKRSKWGWGRIVNGCMCLWKELWIAPVGNSWESRGIKAGERLRFISRRKIYWQQHGGWGVWLTGNSPREGVHGSCRGDNQLILAHHVPFAGWNLNYIYMSFQVWSAIDTELQKDFPRVIMGISQISRPIVALLL